MNVKSSPVKFFPAVQRSAATMLMPLQRELNRIFEDFGEGWSAIVEGVVAPSMDVHDAKTSVEITMEIPGLDLKDVKIELDEDLLTISGEKTAERHADEAGLRISERSYGAFSRSVVLPRSVNPAKIKATMADGVLKIVAPKDAVTATKTIEIQAAK